MWLGCLHLGSCVRRLMPIAATMPLALPIRRCTTGLSTPVVKCSHSSQTGVNLTYTCRLLNSICTADQPASLKRKRIRGAVHKMESSIVDSFAATSATLSPVEKRDFMQRWLQALAQSVEYLPRHDGHGVDDDAWEPERFSARIPRRTRSTANSGDDEAWSGASPYFTLQTNDVLCLCLRECVMGVADTQADALLDLLKCAVVLEVGEVEVLQHLVHALTTVDACRELSSKGAVQLLHFISLAVKRCKLPVPPLNRLLALLPGATLSARDNLMVLSALHRISSVHASDVVASVSRRAAAQVATYNVKDVVFGLEVVALLDGCSEVYAAAVLVRAGGLAPTMTPRQVGAVCKYVALLSTSRRQNALAYSCGAELRQLLPLLVERAEQLLGHFHFRDSRNVLRCFREHKVRHALLFSRLTPLAEDS